MVAMTLQSCSKSTAQSSSSEVVAEFPGYSLEWIEVAKPEFARRNLDLSNYTVLVVIHRDSVIVALTSIDQPEGARGNLGTHPGYEVEISKNKMKILRSSYVR